MKPTPDHLDDETLSALLDGAAVDGLGPADPEIAAHLASCQHCAGRQAELATARAALAATTAEPLDELTRRRLVATAVRAAGATLAAPRRAGRPGWGERHRALLASAAAVVLIVLAGVPFVVGRRPSPSETTLAARAPGGAAREAAAPFLGDLGDLADHEHLRLRLSGGAVNDTTAYAPAEPGPSPAGGATSAGPAPAAAPLSGGLAGSPAAPRAVPPSPATTSGSGPAEAQKSLAPVAGQASATDQAAERDRADTDACVAALLSGPARGGRLTASGTGTWRGRPAVVAAFELSGGTVAFVADRSGCGVLDRFAV